MRPKQDGLLVALLYLCLAGSSLRAAAGSGQSWGFSKEVVESQRNTSVSQTSRVEATHRRPPLTDLGKCKRWSRGKKVLKVTVLDNVTVFKEALSVSEYNSTNLDTVVPDWMKGTKEEVLLDPDPVLVGISKKGNTN